MHTLLPDSVKASNLTIRLRPNKSPDFISCDMGQRQLRICIVSVSRSQVCSSNVRRRTHDDRIEGRRVSDIRTSLPLEESQAAQQTQARREKLRAWHQNQREQAEEFVRRNDLPANVDISSMRDALRDMRPSIVPNTQDEEDAMQEDIDRIRNALWQTVTSLVTSS
ncbi:hypothetical protein PENSPDRAFT_671657 [Peniophora sp. CONT]|nr:hypothetical protein PENSPDRAFT_671657 [Peniophora sp. CONT]